MTPRAERAARRVRVAALLLIGALVAGPVATHVYWMLGGTWGLHRSVDGHIEQSTSTGIRVVAAVVVLLLIGAVLLVLARVRLWQQPLVSDWMISVFAWALAAIFLLETLASFTYSREYEWWLYGPVSLLIAVLALVVAASEPSASAQRPSEQRRAPAVRARARPGRTATIRTPCSR